MLAHPLVQLDNLPRVEALRETLLGLFNLAVQGGDRPLGIGLIDTDPFDPHPSKIRDQFAFKPVYPLQRMSLRIRTGDLLLLHGPEPIGPKDVARGVGSGEPAVARETPEVLHLDAAGARPTKLFAERLDQSFVVLAAELPSFQTAGEVIGAVVFVDQYLVDLRVFQWRGWPDAVATRMEQIERDVEADRAAAAACALRESEIKAAFEAFRR